MTRVFKVQNALQILNLKFFSPNSHLPFTLFKCAYKSFECAWHLANDMREIRIVVLFFRETLIR